MSGGAAAFRAEIPVTAGTLEGQYDLVYKLQRCDGGAALSPTGTRSYRVDNTAPTLGPVSPTGWSGPSATIAVPVADQSGIDRTASTVTVDGDVVDATLEGGALTAHPSGLATGPHHVAVHVADSAGNVAEATAVFNVDADATTFAGHAPTGTVDDLTPRIQVDVVDAGSGADLTSASVTLEYLGQSCALTAQTDGVDTIYVDIPDVPSGTCTGRGPLLPGAYEVTVSIADHVGNQSTTTWSFSVMPAATSVLP